MACVQGRGLTFKESVARDAFDPRAWFNLNEFAREINIDGHKVIGILSRRNFTGRLIPMTSGYSREHFFLAVRTCDISGVAPGQSVRIDGQMYIVSSYEDMCGTVYHIELDRVES